MGTVVAKATSIPMPRAAYSNAKALAEVRAKNDGTRPVEVFVSPRRDAVVIGAESVEDARARVLAEAIRNRIVDDGGETEDLFSADQVFGESGEFVPDRDPSVMRWVSYEDPSHGRSALVWRAPLTVDGSFDVGDLPRALDTSSARFEGLGGVLMTLTTGRISISLSRSQKTIGDVASMSGVSENELASIAAGRSLPSRAALLSVSGVVEVTPQWLGGRESPGDAGEPTPTVATRGIASLVPSIPQVMLDEIIGKQGFGLGDTDVFDRMALVRRVSGLSVKSMIRRLSETATNTDEETIIGYEGGDVSAPVVVMREWARACGVSWEWLLTGATPSGVRLERMATARRVSGMSNKAMASALWDKASWYRRVPAVEIGEEPVSRQEQDDWMKACGFDPDSIWLSDEQWAGVLAGFVR